MDTINLSELFNKRLFRVPDFQRGYAWENVQLEAFWHDFLNLREDRSHYAGLITLEEIPKEKISTISIRDRWLMDVEKYKAFSVIDGQQRLTTSVIFIQSLIETVRELPENAGKELDAIHVVDGLSLAKITEDFICKRKRSPSGVGEPCYKFGYMGTGDNPSADCLRFEILKAEAVGPWDKTLYTANLLGAKAYFKKVLSKYIANTADAWEVYQKFTEHFLFKEFLIEKSFDVFVTFETMNMRGKPLSTLELLKNRLIYLTSLYSVDELGNGERDSLRKLINDTWKVIYQQLGRGAKLRMRDDDFLKDHWLFTEKYTRAHGLAYKRFLLDEHFIVARVYRVDVVDAGDDVEEYDDSDSGEYDAGVGKQSDAKLEVREIQKYVESLRGSVKLWVDSHFTLSWRPANSEDEVWLDKLNRLGMGSLRPLVTVVLKNVMEASVRARIFKEMERFLFVSFRLTQCRSDFGNSDFYRAAKELNDGVLSVDDLLSQLRGKTDWSYSKNKDKFYRHLHDKSGGYYEWVALKYFLFEYESHLAEKNGSAKVDWSAVRKEKKNKVTIEHIYPQTPDKEWERVFTGDGQWLHNHLTSLGNMLLLSHAKNASLQNHAYAVKRERYQVGSYSENEVARDYVDWTPDAVRTRGLKLLDFMSERWGITMRRDEKEKLLFLDWKE